MTPVKIGFIRCSLLHKQRKYLYKHIDLAFVLALLTGLVDQFEFHLKLYADSNKSIYHIGFETKMSIFLHINIPYKFC